VGAAKVVGGVEGVVVSMGVAAETGVEVDVHGSPITEPPEPIVIQANKASCASIVTAHADVTAASVGYIRSA
jgi:hypothetical protein